MAPDDPMAGNGKRDCTAHNRQGERCTRPAVPGALVCRYHGGSAPQVKNAARRRLLEAADPAAARLVELLDSSKEDIALRAATALLDRAGHGAGIKIGGDKSEEQVEEEIAALLDDRQTG